MLMIAANAVRPLSCLRELLSSSRVICLLQGCLKNIFPRPGELPMFHRETLRRRPTAAVPIARRNRIQQCWNYLHLVEVFHPFASPEQCPHRKGYPAASRVRKRRNKDKSEELQFRTGPRLKLESLECSTGTVVHFTNSGECRAK